MACLVLVVMVAGCGSNVADPQKCEALAVEIVANGAIASEYQAEGVEAMADLDMDAATGLLENGQRALERAQEADDEYVALGCKDGEHDGADGQSLEQRIEELKAESVESTGSSSDPNIVTTMPSTTSASSTTLLQQQFGFDETISAWFGFDDPGSIWVDSNPACSVRVLAENLAEVVVEFDNVLDDRANFAIELDFETVEPGVSPLASIDDESDGVPFAFLAPVDPGERVSAVLEMNEDNGFILFLDTRHLWTCSLTYVSFIELPASEP